MAANTLPVLLISAKESTQAKLLATELINNKDDTEVNGSVQENFVWRLQNKYYSANVRIFPVGDDDSIENDVLSLAEAHIICISKEEKDLVELAQKRAAIVNNAEVDIHLLLYEGSKTPSALAAWACNNHYEAIPLEETASSHSEENEDNPASHSDEEEDNPDGPFKETYGIERARDTLHAHTWTGLEKIDIPAQIKSFDGSSSSYYISSYSTHSSSDDNDDNVLTSLDDEWYSTYKDEEDLTEEHLERAETFAMAIETILQARERRREGNDEMRRLNAEIGVNIIREALGVDFNWL